MSCEKEKKIQGHQIFKSLREVESINGAVIYNYDLSGTELKAVFKYEYSKLPDYRIAINKDSLKLGIHLLARLSFLNFLRYR